MIRGLRVRSWGVALAVIATAVAGCKGPTVASGSEIAAAIKLASPLISDVVYNPRNPMYGTYDDITIEFTVDAADQDIVRVYCGDIEPRTRGVFHDGHVFLFRPPTEDRRVEGWMSLFASLPDCSRGADAPLPTERCYGTLGQCDSPEPVATPVPSPT